VFLACRPYEDNLFNTGRETFMHPVEWADGWPNILNPGMRVPPVLAAPGLIYDAPAPNPSNGNFRWRDEFQDRKLMPLWNTLRGPGDKWIKLVSHPGTLSITPQSDRLTSFGAPAFLGRRQQHASFLATVSMTLPQSTGVSAGMAAFQNETFHFYLGVRKSGDGWMVFLERSAGGEPEIVAERDIAPGAVENIHLRIEGRGRPYSFSFSSGGEEWIPVGEDQDGSILSTQKAGGFVGTFLGMHARLE
jgi:alpha-N-arabinofuranosidase